MTPGWQKVRIASDFYETKIKLLFFVEFMIFSLKEKKSNKKKSQKTFFPYAAEWKLSDISCTNKQ